MNSLRQKILRAFPQAVFVSCRKNGNGARAAATSSGTLFAATSALAAKPTLVALSRIDACPDVEATLAAVRALAGAAVPLSSVTGLGVRDVLDRLDALVTEAREA